MSETGGSQCCNWDWLIAFTRSTRSTALKVGLTVVDIQYLLYDIDMLSRTDTVQTVAEAIATDLFISMLNPEYRGPKFDYKGFDIERHVEAHIGISVSWTLTKKQMEHACTCARRIWTRWITTAGKGIPETV